ncbi:MAG: hypothetical protein U5L11_06315 [Arhodomonas sp.]|nr:hypothetical protein [Arhodomonas sp.]
MIAQSGDRLLQEAAIAALVGKLLPRATLITAEHPGGRKSRRATR